MFKLYFTLISVCAVLPIFGQNESKFLYLENDATGKIKKINLDHTSNLEFAIDSAFTSYITYSSDAPEKCLFGEKQVEFIFDDYSESYSTDNDKGYYSFDKSIWLDEDSSLMLNYTNPNPDISISMFHQTKTKSVFFGIGVGISYLAAINAMWVAPFIGMNNGSFKNYNWQRFWRFELYSACALGVGIPLGLIFQEKEYHFQTAGSYNDTWHVVDKPVKE
ncbi:MAG: hypothetical protein IPM74_10155 [Crocinitomicaceae bacterium]|nr:hypothetical protein [Crocinitomicaceae bacterium]MBK8926255.1 hypothetical protein [Crocinitomicaceae bacterium]